MFAHIQTCFPIHQCLITPFWLYRQLTHLTDHCHHHLHAGHVQAKPLSNPVLQYSCGSEDAMFSPCCKFHGIILALLWCYIKLGILLQTPCWAASHQLWCISWTPSAHRPPPGQGSRPQFRYMADAKLMSCMPVQADGWTPSRIFYPVCLRRQ
jgi:hypothetical protein